MDSVSKGLSIIANTYNIFLIKIVIKLEVSIHLLDRFMMNM